MSGREGVVRCLILVAPGHHGEWTAGNIAGAAADRSQVGQGLNDVPRATRNSGIGNIGSDAVAHSSAAERTNQWLKRTGNKIPLPARDCAVVAVSSDNIILSASHGCGRCLAAVEV